MNDPWNPGQTIKSKNLKNQPAGPGFRDRSGYGSVGAGVQSCPQSVPSLSASGSLFIRGTVGIGVAAQFNLSKTITKIEDVNSLSSFFSNWSAQGSIAAFVAGASVEAGVGGNVDGWLFYSK